jgi:hypothetical protein
MTTSILIETTSENAVAEIFSIANPTAGVSVSDSGSRASLRLVDRPHSLGIGLGETVVVVFDLLPSPEEIVSTAVIAKWLYSKLSKRARSVEHDGKIYRITEGDLSSLVISVVKALRRQDPSIAQPPKDIP